jgi:hypothetical protein
MRASPAKLCKHSARNAGNRERMPACSALNGGRSICQAERWVLAQEVEVDVLQALHPDAQSVIRATYLTGN